MEENPDSDVVGKEESELAPDKFEMTAQAGGTCGEDLDWTFSEGILTIRGTGDMYSYDTMYHPRPWSDYVSAIQQVEIGEEVTSIGAYAFYGCKNLQTINLTDGITSIGAYAFYNCTKLQKVELQDGIGKIGAYAFYGCETLKSIYIPEGISDINDYTFYGCSRLEKVTIPDSVVAIGRYAFYGCSKMSAAAFGTKLARIRKYAFAECESLLSVTLPDSVTTLEEYAFYDCSGIRKVTLSSNLPQICQYSFYNCSSIEAIEIPGNVGKIGAYAFYNCTNMKTLSLGGALSIIEERAFTGCSSLTELKCPDGLKTIERSAFYQCINLSSVLFSKKLETIGDYAFDGCKKITKLDLPDSLLKIGECAFARTNITEISIPTNTEVGDGVFEWCNKLEYLEIGKLSSLGNLFTNRSDYLNSYTTVPATLKTVLIKGEVGANAFYNCKSVKNIFLPKGLYCSSTGLSCFFGASEKLRIFVGANSDTDDGRTEWKYISDSTYAKVLYGCRMEDFRRLAELDTTQSNVVIPDGVQKIPSNFFEDMTSLQSITIPDSVCQIEKDAFKGCTALKKINISSIEAWTNCAYINKFSHPNYYGDEISLNGSPVTKIQMPENTTSVGEYSYYNFKDLTEVTFHANINKIEDYAFYNCSGLERVDIPANILSVGKNAFGLCNSLKMVNFEEGLQLLGDYAFAKCGSLKKVVLPDSLMEVGEYCFSNCTSLESAKLSEDMTVLASHLFYNDAKLKEVLIGKVTKQIDAYAFANCGNLFSIRLPEGVEQIGTRAFSNCTGLFTIYCEGPAISIGANAFYGVKSEVYYKEETWEKDTLKDYGGELTWKVICTSHVEEKRIIDIVEATCTEEGSYVEENYCAVCGMVINQKVQKIPATGHIYEYEDLKEATCTESGERQAVCSVCGNTVSEIIPSLGHKYTERILSEKYRRSDASCDMPESFYYACANCGDISTDYFYYGVERGHEPEAIIGYAATCTENGMTDGERCSVCGEILTQRKVISKLGHAYLYKTQDATCTEEGLKTGTCSRCGDVVTIVIPATGHSYQKKVKAATCTERGYVYYVCNECGDQYIDTATYTEKTEHRWNSGVVTVAPTASEKGKMIYTCTICGATREEEIEAVALATGYANSEKTAKWTVYTNGTLAITGSGKIKSWMSVVDMPWYNYRTQITQINIDEGITAVGDFSFANLPNITEIIIPKTVERIGGVIVNSGCSKLKHIVFTGEAISNIYNDAFGGATAEIYYKDNSGWTEEIRQSYGGNIVWTPYCIYSKDAGVMFHKGGQADCHTKAICSLCGKPYGEYDNSKHELTQKVVKRANCSNTGIRQITCRYCDYKTELTIEKDAGIHTGNQIIKNAKAETCEEKGYTGDICCKDCGEVLSKGEEIPAAGHTWKIEKRVEPTALKQGYILFRCKCGAEKKDQFTEATGIFKVIFEGNGYTAGTMKCLTLQLKDTNYLPECSFERKGYLFVGYNTAADGTGKSYSTGEILDSPMLDEKDTFTLYAQWKVNQYLLEFDADGGNVSYSSKYVVYEEKYGEFPIAVKAGYTFAGWADKNGKKVTEEDFVTEDSNQVLHAQWMKNHYSITFDSQGGSPVDGMMLYYGDSYRELPVPVYMNHMFTGWYTEPEAGEMITADMVYNIAGDQILYAHWEYKYTVEKPVFSPAPGSEIKKGQRIRISTETNGAEIYYSVDGTDPVISEETLYEDTIVITENVTVKAIAVKAGYETSEIATAEYVIENTSEDWGDVLEEDRDAYATADDIPDALWLCGVSDKEYCGTAITFPDLRVYDHKVLLKAGVDYSVKYANNVKAGTAKVIVNGKGNYTGTIIKTFVINRISLGEEGKNDEKVKILDITLPDNGRVQKGTTTVMYTANGKTIYLKKGVDFVYTYSSEYDYKTPGEHIVTITGKGNYSGTAVFKETIDSKVKLINRMKISKVGSVSATGSEVRPEVEIYDGFSRLEKGRDYTLEWRNNVLPGKGMLIITGKGDYAGSKIMTFQITAVSISKVSVDGITVKDYTGTETVQTGYVVKYKANKDELEEVLKEGIDYTVSYENHVNAGENKAAIIFTGKGRFTGSVKKKYSIRKYQFTDTNVMLSGIGKYPYEKGGVKPDIEVTVDGKVLKSGTDYTVKYANNMSQYSGTEEKKMPSVTVIGKGNYKGTVKKTFLITCGSLANTKISVSDIVYRNKADICKPTIALYDRNGKKLSAGVDYDAKNISYVYAKDTEIKRIDRDKRVTVEVKQEGTEVDLKNDIIPAGAEIRVIIQGKGNYSDSVQSKVFRFVQTSLIGARVKITPQIYSGMPLELNKEQIEISVGSGKSATILAKTDYEIVEYSQNVNKGTGSVTIRGVGNYGGEKTVHFKIDSKNMKYTIIYDKNSAFATGTMKKGTLAYGERLSSNLYKWTGHKFLGWSFSADGDVVFSDKGILMTEGKSYGYNIRLYAIWQ